MKLFLIVILSKSIKIYNVKCVWLWKKRTFSSEDTSLDPECKILIYVFLSKNVNVAGCKVEAMIFLIAAIVLLVEHLGESTETKGKRWADNCDIPGHRRVCQMEGLRTQRY